MSKQEVSSQQAILPKLSTSESTQLPKLHVHQKTENTSASWTKLVTDIFHFQGASYLLIVDYRSRFLIVYNLSSVTGVHFANQCKLLFSEYGWHKT